MTNYGSLNLEERAESSIHNYSARQQTEMLRKESVRVLFQDGRNKSKLTWSLFTLVLKYSTYSMRSDHDWSTLNTGVNELQDVFKAHSLKLLAEVVQDAFDHIMFCGVNTNAS